MGNFFDADFVFDYSVGNNIKNEGRTVMLKKKSNEKKVAKEVKKVLGFFADTSYGNASMWGMRQPKAPEKIEK